VSLWLLYYKSKHIDVRQNYELGDSFLYNFSSQLKTLSRPKYLFNWDV